MFLTRQQQLSSIGVSQYQQYHQVRLQQQQQMMAHQQMVHKQQLVFLKHQKKMESEKNATTRKTGATSTAPLQIAKQQIKLNNNTAQEINTIGQ